MRLRLLPLLAGSGFLLSGCVASMAASAVGAAVQASRPRPVEVTDDRRAVATAACQARAGGAERTRIIDAEQRRYGHVVVWGTVGEGPERRAFECRYDGTVKSFKLRPIPAR